MNDYHVPEPQARAGNLPSDQAWPQHPEPEHTIGGAYEGQGDADSQGHFAPRRTFRRPRAGRACGTCHSRRVRCDAGSRGLPCTNCEAFSLECSIPPKRKKKKREGETVGVLKRVKQRARSERTDEKDEIPFDKPTVSSPHDFASLILQADEHIKKQPDIAPRYASLVKHGVDIIKQEAVEPQVEDPGNIAYLEEFSNLSLLINDYEEPTAGGVHFSWPKGTNDSIEIPTKMNQVELQILNKRGALSLPPKDLCDELVNAYFKWVAPVVPMVNRTRFMQQYRDPKNPPPILLMQAILLAGSRVCTTEMLMDSNGSPIPAATLFYQRAKALYDADYEQDRLTIVQALILMGWYWEEPGKVTKNVFYWNGLATTIAHGTGMHRNPKNSKLSETDKKLWKRIWWTLFTRDRSVAVAVGRPPHINMRDSDMPMLCEDDFIEDDNNVPNSLHTQFFLQYVKMCQIMDLVLIQNYSISARARSYNAMALTQCDAALAEWIQNCPREIQWNQSRHNFWSAYLASIYQTTICLLHRAHLPPAPSPAMLPSLSRSPAFVSARTLTSIVETLVAHNELRYCPPFMIYSLLSTLIVQIYQLYIAVPGTSQDQIRQISICMDALERVSEIWLVAKAVQDLFESVLSSAGYEKSLEAPVGLTYRKRIETGDPGPTVNIKKEMTSGASLNGKPGMTKSMPLTPALRIWAEVALKSAETPKISKSPPAGEVPITSSSSRNNTLEPLTFSDQWQDESQPPISPPAQIYIQTLPQAPFVHNTPAQIPYNVYEPMMTYIPDDQDLSWNHQWADGNIPAPTGFNAAEWFEFFGIR